MADGYNPMASFQEGAVNSKGKGPMTRKTVTSIRCVPRYGYDFAEVRSLDVEVGNMFDEEILRDAIERFFLMQGIGDAVYAIDVDDDGYFAIINDEAYQDDWGEAVF